MRLAFLYWAFATVGEAPMSASDSMERPVAPIERRVDAVRAALEAHGAVRDELIVEATRNADDQWVPENGAGIVARAWTDPAYRALLLADGNAAASQFGFTVAPPADGGYQLRVVANTEQVHNVIVCTLCSCYPVSLLGPSPGWYKSFAYRSRTVREPRAVLAEFGVTLPDTTRISVWDSTSEARYLVLPARPAGTGALGEDQLTALVTRNGLIGTALV